MGRKKAIKKKFGISRKRIYEILRDRGNQEVIVLDNGSEVLINPLKHILENDKYKNSDMNKYLGDVLKQYKAFVKQTMEENKPVENTGGENIES